MSDFTVSPVKFAKPPRPLHWVFKISDLKATISLLTILGARVLRHEEFEEGCDATCNGPYDSYWSKTMCGWEIEDTSFVFELTYNYGIDNYRRGNDLEGIILYKYDKNGQDMEEKMKKEFPES